MTRDAQLAQMDHHPRPFGRYLLLHRIATGGMANVYLAQINGESGFKKDVAIKTIHDHLAQDQEFIDMFIDEAQLVSGISHANVAQVHELGRIGSSYYMAMEYVHGECLMRLVRRVKVPLELSCRVVASVAAGLHAAHELRDDQGASLGVVHRDISPNNILVGYDGEVKLIDFGVAKAEGALHVSKAGALKGKYAYMSPEQLRGEAVDRRSDVFSLGVVLYEITTRHRLFRGDSEADSIGKVLHMEIPSPSSVDPDYPVGLELIVNRALARDRTRRYQSAEELQEALERYLVSSGRSVMPQELGRLMREAFADQLAHKGRLRREIGRGSTVSETEQATRSLRPATEQVEASGAAAEETLRTRRRRWGPALVLVLLVALALGYLHYAYPVGQTSEQSPSQRAATGQEQRPRPAAQRQRPRPPRPAPRIPLAAPAQPGPELITIAISARPRQARIFFQGQQVENPFRVRRAAAEARAPVVVRARGYVTSRLELDLSHSAHWRLELRRRRQPEPALRSKPVLRTASVDVSEPAPQLEPPARRQLFPDPY